MKRKWLYPELTYKVRKIIFDIHNTFGPIFKEEIYEKAMIIGIRKLHIPIEDQIAFILLYKSVQVGYYIADLLVDQKIILEITDHAYSPYLSSLEINF